MKGGLIIEEIGYDVASIFRYYYNTIYYNTNGSFLLETVETGADVR